MASGHVQVAPDSTGKQVDSQSVVSTESGTPTVYRQTVTLGDPSTYGSIASIKAASTAIAATDNPLAVGLHPTSPLPTGTNSIGTVGINAALPTGANTIGAVTVGNLDVALSTRLKPADTLAGVTTVAAVTAITNALPTGTNAIGTVAINAALPTGTNSIGAFTNTNLDVALSTRLKPGDTLTGVTTVSTVTAVTAITNALPAGGNAIGTVSINAALPTGTNSIGAVTNANLDVALSTRLKPADTLAGITTVSAVTAITNALPAGTNALGTVGINAALPTGANTIGGVTLASAIPTGTNVIGGVTNEVNPSVSGTAQTPLFAVINASASGANAIVAANTTKTIRVLSLTVISAGTVSITWESGTTALSGAMPLVANSGYTNQCNYGLFATAINSALNLNLSAAIAVTGHCSYILV